MKKKKDTRGECDDDRKLSPEQMKDHFGPDYIAYFSGNIGGKFEEPRPFK